MTKGTHILPYIQIGAYHRPIIPLFLRFRDITIEYHALVDSGADFNLFPVGLAGIFGIELDNAQKEPIYGIGGEAVAYPYLFDLGLENKKFFRVPVMLTPELSLDGYGIVGQVGFFDKFTVEFTYARKSIAITAV